MGGEHPFDRNRCPPALLQSGARSSSSPFIQQSVREDVHRIGKTAPPEPIEANSKRMTGSTFEKINGCGHYPWAEAPDAFWTKLEPFLAQFR